jgi:hypothetical protein
MVNFHMYWRFLYAHLSDFFLLLFSSSAFKHFVASFRRIRERSWAKGIMGPWRNIRSVRNDESSMEERALISWVVSSWGEIMCAYANAMQ